MSASIMKFLLVIYAVIAISSLYERNYPRALYWLCAGGITFSVLWMGISK